ncbi:MAG: sensor histidine kinase, partial [Bacteroidota bacterium]
FIENAFKHGVSQALKGAEVRIALIEKGNMLVFSIFNTVPLASKPAGKQPKSALGLKNVHKQLELLYPGKHELRINENSDSYSITLTIPA